MFRVGVIGATGYIGVPYRREIREAAGQGRVTWLCGRRESLLRQAGGEDPEARLTTDWREVIAAEDVDIVLIATPDHQHHEAAMACADAGKHVICEKPIGMDCAQANEIRTAFAAANLASFVPFWTRFVPSMQRCRELFLAGAIGEPRAVLTRWHNARPVGMPHTWRDDAAASSAGTIADVGSHAYDTLRWLLGEDAEQVFAHGEIIAPNRPDIGDVNLSEALNWEQRGDTQEANSQLRRATAINYANISAVFESGVVATILLSHDSSIRRGPGPDLELHGSEASLFVSRESGEIRLATSTESHVIEVVPFEPWTDRFGQHVFPAFERALSGVEPNWPDLEAGFQSQRFTDAAKRSAEHRTWVTLE
jgi:predicted dehydrogenase